MELQRAKQKAQQSVLEDQYERFGTRNHYLRKTVVSVDSVYRNRNDHISAKEMFYTKLGILFTHLFPNNIYFYHRNHGLAENTNLYLKNVGAFSQSINDTPYTLFEFDSSVNAPIFTIKRISNTDILNLFTWTFIKPLVSSEYDSEDQFTADTTYHFYYFPYISTTSGNVSLQKNDYITFDTTKTIRIFSLETRVIGYPKTSYYKIELSKKFYNIYRIKMLDIRIPNIVYNVSSESYSFGDLRFLENAKLRFILETDNHIVSNINYVSSRIRYDFFTKNSVYDVSGYWLDIYKYYNSDNYPNVYLAKNIYTLMSNILKSMKTNKSLEDFVERNLFEIAYYFFIQYSHYYSGVGLETFALERYNVPSSVNETYYIYTLDLFKSFLSETNQQMSILMRPLDVLNNKMPLIYANDMIMYVNNETYRIQCKIANWLDFVPVPKTTETQVERSFLSCYTTVNRSNEQLVGTIQNTVLTMTSAPYAGASSAELQYKLGITVTAPSFIPTNMFGTIVFMVNENGIIEYDRANTIYTYTTYDASLDMYYFQTRFSVACASHFYRRFLPWNAVLYRTLTPDTAVSSNNSITQPIRYIFTLKVPNATPLSVAPETLVNTILYSRTTGGSRNEAYIPNDTVKYYGAFTSVPDNCVYYYYESSTRIVNPSTNQFSDNLSFAFGNIIYCRIEGGGTVSYQAIGTVSEAYDTITTVELAADYLTAVGTVICENLTEFRAVGYTKTTNPKLRSGIVVERLSGDAYVTDVATDTVNSVVKTQYVVATNSKVSNNPSNYLSSIFYGSQNVSFFNPRTVLDVGTILDTTTPLPTPNHTTTVTVTYERIGTIRDIVYTICIEPSIYDIDFTSGQTTIYSLNNIRIKETATPAVPTVVNYVGRYIVVNNSEYAYRLRIISQPILDTQMNLFLFEVSLRTTLPLEQNAPDVYVRRSSRIYLVDIVTNSTTESDVLGTAYTILYDPVFYTLLVEKDDAFNMEFLYNLGEYVFKTQPIGNNTSAFLYTKYNARNSPYNLSAYPNRNAIIANPEKTSLQGMKTYDLYPVYEVSLKNGYYNDTSFIRELTTQLNDVKYKHFNYMKGIFETTEATNRLIGDANYEEPVFKVVSNNTTREIDIALYKRSNRKHYTAFYNPMIPYIYFRVDNATIENNRRIFIEVDTSSANTNISPTVLTVLSNNLNKEITTRSLPVFHYQFRVLYPMQSLSTILNSVPAELRKNITSIQSLLYRISLQPFRFRVNYPNTTNEISYAGQMLRNLYNNGHQYVGFGKSLFNAGVPCPFQENEPLLVLNSLYYSHEHYKFARISSIVDSISNSNGNYGVNVQMTGSTRTTHPFLIGDIVFGMNSKAIAMIVPYTWGSLTEFPQIADIHSGLPSEDTLKLGFKNYIKFLYKHSGKPYLLDMIRDYNYQAYINTNPLTSDSDLNLQGYQPFTAWAIQEMRNCQRGFEVYFEYDDEFTVSHKDLKMRFLKENRYCMFLGKNTQGRFDSPKDILGFSDTSVLNLYEYQNVSTSLPWSHSFNNLVRTDVQTILRMYLTYGVDNILANRMYLNIDNVSTYKIGDKLRIKDMDVRPDVSRSVFNIFNTENHNIKSMCTFEMYLGYVVYRLSFVSLGVPIPLSVTDYMRVVNKNIKQMSDIVNALYIEKSSAGVEDKNSIRAYTDMLLENYASVLAANNVSITQPDITYNLTMNNNVPSSFQVSAVIRRITDVLVLKYILPWFVVKENMMIWTRGDMGLYTHIRDEYIDRFPADDTLATSQIWRCELELMDDFVFVPNLRVYLKNGDGQAVYVGRITYNNLYSDYRATDKNRNSNYTVYIDVALGNVSVLSGITAGTYLYAEDLLVKNRVLFNIFRITQYNNYIYLYDTYLKFKTVVQLVSNNTNTTLQDTLNFNKVDNIETTFFNLFNNTNQNIDSFRNGYYVSIAEAEHFTGDNGNSSNASEASTAFLGTFRTMLNLLDTRSLFNLCQTDELYGGLQIINSIEEIQNFILYRVFGESKDISQITRLIGIAQLLSDLTPSSTIMLDMTWTNEIEQKIYSWGRYQLRRQDNQFQIVGEQNYYLEKMRYIDDFIYGNADESRFRDLFGKVVSDDTLKSLNGFMTTPITINSSILSTIENLYCSMSAIRTVIPTIDGDMKLFDEPSPFLNTLLWMPMKTGDTIAYIICGNEQRILATMNRCKLVNYIVVFNTVFIDQQRTFRIEDMERNRIIQSNVIKSISPVVASAETDDAYKLANPVSSIPSYQTTYRIFRVELLYPVKYNIERGIPVVVKDYYTTLYKPVGMSVRNQRIVFIKKNWGILASEDSSQFTLEKNMVLRFNYGSNNIIYKQYLENGYSEFNDFVEDDIIHEDTNIVESIESDVSGNPIVYSNTVQGVVTYYYKVTLVNTMRYEYADGITVVVSTIPLNTGRTDTTTNNMLRSSGDTYSVYNGTISSPNTVISMNNIFVSGLATQNILVNGEWHTRIFYQSERNLDILGINLGGVKGISENSRRQVYIYGMRGYVLPNVGFQALERGYLNSAEVTLEEYQKNAYMKPVPDGLYEVVSVLKEDNMSILDGSYLPINGTFIPMYTVRGSDQPEEWIDNYANYRWFYAILRNNIDPTNMSSVGLKVGDELLQYNHYPIQIQISTVFPDRNNEFVMILPQNPSVSDLNSYSILLNGGYTTIADFISDLNSVLSTKSFTYWNGTAMTPMIMFAEYVSFYNVVRIRFRNAANMADISLSYVSLDLTMLTSAYRVLGFATKEIFQFTNVSAIQPTIYSAMHTRMDVVCNIYSIDSTGQMFDYNGTSYNVYKVTVRVDIRSLASGFLTSSATPEVRLTTEDDRNSFTTPPKFITNLSNRVGTVEIKPIYYQYDQNVASANVTSALNKTSYHSITIKGRYQGFGGTISLDTKSTIFNSIEYTVSDVNTSTNTLEIDLEDNKGLYTTFYRLNQSGKNRSRYSYYPYYAKQPISTTQINPVFGRFAETVGLRSTFKKSRMEVIEQYDIYPNRYGYMATNGVVYKPLINRPYSTDTLDYIFMCIRNIPTDFILEQNNMIGNHIVFAKIYINKATNNYDLDITNYEIVYDISLLPNLDSLEVYYIDKGGNLLNFNNIDNNFVLEIHEYVERVKTINTKNAMVY